MLSLVFLKQGTSHDPKTIALFEKWGGNYTSLQNGKNKISFAAVAWECPPSILHLLFPEQEKDLSSI